jgi:large subunit ribosomal protein L13
MKTQVTKISDIKRAWHLVDAADQILGRLSTGIAGRLIGKDKPYFVSGLDCGDYVVVTNAARFKLTGNKATQKKYYRHSGYPGGFRETSIREQTEKDPRQVIRFAVTNMLPKNKLRDRRLARLKIYAGSEHPYEDKFKSPRQKPQPKAGQPRAKNPKP